MGAPGQRHVLGAWLSSLSSMHDRGVSETLVTGAFSQSEQSQLRLTHHAAQGVHNGRCRTQWVPVGGIGSIEWRLGAVVGSSSRCQLGFDIHS